MILNKDVLVNNIVTELSDNSTGQISPYDIRHNLIDIIDSVHLLTKGKPLEGSNFSTPDTRSTSVGFESLSKVNLAGHFSIDNTAIGHSALKGNYQGIKNTAVGSQSLFCNVYGENNAGFGYAALAGNTVGHGNVGLGNFTLHNNKGGNFNIAIGHGAGYYAKNVSNKLFIASHNVDSTYICDNPDGIGLKPLVYGDLENLKLGISVDSLHSDGVLQVGGNISPSNHDAHNLGSSAYSFHNLYLSSGVYFDSQLYLKKLDSANLQLHGNLLPFTHDTYTLGDVDNLWNFGYFHNIYVSGTANIHRFNAVESCNYFCKTINLASSGSVSLDGGGPVSLYDYSGEASPLVSDCGYLNDTELTGAGFVIQSSGDNAEIRQYGFTFVPSGNHLECRQSEDVYASSFWKSDISIHLASGTHLATDRVIFPSSINIVNNSGCFGIFSKEDDLFFSKEDILSLDPHQHPSGYLAGVGSINFYAESGISDDYIVNFASPESGVIIRQRFLNGVKNKRSDILNNNKDILNGFEIQYIDDSNSVTYGPTADRLVIGSYNNTSNPINALTVMKSDADEGIVGITNLTPNSEFTLPETSLNIRSANNAIGRFTAENYGDTISAIQLLGESNCLASGLEIAYLNGSGLADISMFINYEKEVFFRFYDNNTVGLFTSSGTKPTVNDMFTMGDEHNDNALISMYENNETVGPRQKHAKIYVREKIRPRQQHTIYVTDGEAYLHDLIINPLDTTEGRGLYTDPSGNTFGGLYCPDNRDDLSNTFRNTAIGSGAIGNLINGDDNTIFGANAGSGITGGNRNSIFGSMSANSVRNGNNNIVLGYKSFIDSSSSASSNIIIGNQIGSGIGDSYNFLVGDNDKILLEGKMGPYNVDKFIAMPSGGKFGLYDNNNVYSLWIEPKSITLTEDDTGDKYPDSSLTVRFAGEEIADLLIMNHNADPMTNSVNYRLPIDDRPYAELKGDFRLRGSIRFSDNTSLSSASFLTNINNLESDLSSTKDDVSYLLGSFVEGYVSDAIAAPISGENPTTGTLNLRGANFEYAIGNDITLVNRDTTLSIHAGAYVIAIRINNEFRPLWISASDTKCQCCR